MSGDADRLHEPTGSKQGAGAACRVGCSGWQYRHWRGLFYPQDLPAARWLEHYAATFDTSR